MSAIPPGWYKDPADLTTQRWWDGEGWLGDPIPADATPPPGPPAVAPAMPAPEPVEPPSAAAGPVPAPVATVTPGPAPEPGAPPSWPMSHRYPVAVPRPHGFLLASVGSRFMARLVDILVVLVLAAVANVWFAIEFWRNAQPILTWLVTQPSTVETVPATAERAYEMLTLMVVVLTAVWFAYEVPASANSGQTLGKRIFGIRIVREEADGRLGFGRSLRRWFRLAWPTPFWVACCGASAIWQVIDCLFVVTDRRAHQALHDRITRTLVVQVPRTAGPESPDKGAGVPASPSNTSGDARGADAGETAGDARGADAENTSSDPRGAEVENTLGGIGADPR